MGMGGGRVGTGARGGRENRKKIRRKHNLI